MRIPLLLPVIVLVACASQAPREHVVDEALCPVKLIPPVPLPPAPPLLASGRPAPGPLPSPPGTERPDEEAAPAAVVLGPDAAQVGRMGTEGLVARFDFEADAGDLSLFELTAWGYTRGWSSSAALVIRDEGGVEVARSDRAGGTVYQDVLSFAATEAGAYSLELVAVESGFRYRVVRHASFTPRVRGERFRVGEAGVVHDWLADREDSVTFQIGGEPGERIVLRAEPTTVRGMRQKRSLRRKSVLAAAGFVELERLRERAGRRLQDDGSFPDLELDLDEAVRVEGHAHAAVVRVPESGSFDVTVTRSNAGPPGLFDLTIERAIEFAPAELRIGDEDDDPVANAELVLLREPWLDRVGTATTDAAGIARVDVPVGDYTLVFRGPGGRPVTLRTRLTGEPVNLVLDGS